MPTRKKTKSPDEQSMDILSFLAKVVQDSAITIFWESVDRFKHEVKVKLEIGFQFVLGVIAILVGLIFVLVGLADFLEDLVGVKGIGFVLTGILVTIAGIYIGEKSKKRNQVN